MIMNEELLMVCLILIGIKVVNGLLKEDVEIRFIGQNFNINVSLKFLWDLHVILIFIWKDFLFQMVFSLFLI